MPGQSSFTPADAGPKGARLLQRKYPQKEEEGYEKGRATNPGQDAGHADGLLLRRKDDEDPPLAPRPWPR
jgi:hypothetical protein